MSARAVRGIDVPGATWPEVGKTYLCPDGIVRFCTGRGTSGVYYLWWRATNGDRWFDGGTVGGTLLGKPHLWSGGEEIAGPQPGDTVKKVGVLGHETAVVIR